MGALSHKKNAVQRKSPLIFVITGTQEPFDRMVEIIDEWAGTQDKYRVVAQVAKSKVDWENIKSVDFLEPDLFSDLFKKADIIIGHAGMGTIIKAIENKKKLIIFPRQVKFGEHRNDHQMFTAKNFDKSGFVNVAYTKNELSNYLFNMKNLEFKKTYSSGANDDLIKSIFDFIQQ